MFRFTTLAAVAFVALTMSASNAQAQNRHHAHNHGHNHHGNGHHHGHHNNHGHHHNHHGHHNHHWKHGHHNNHHWNHGHRNHNNLLVVRRPVVQVQLRRPAVPKFFGPGHFRFKSRFHTLVTKNKLPLQVRWQDGKYWINHNDAWVVYDVFVKEHCGGNWDWYLSKHRKKYGF